MDIPLLALWFVCALGATVFAAVAPMTRVGAFAGLIAFGVGVWWMRQPFAPPVAGLALAAALVAAAQLVRAPRRPYGAFMAGLLAGAWTAVLEYQGLPLAAAVLVAAFLPAASAYLRVRRTAFAPPLLREEALFFMIVLALAAGAAPGITDGWHAAANLNLQVREPAAAATAPAAMPMWTLGVASLALVSGGLFSLWSRR